MRGVAVCLVLVVPTLVWGQAQILEVHEGLGDFDIRTGRVSPAPQQLAAVSALGAEARWNRFGTPQSLFKDGGFLASGLSGDAVTAAREWIRANRALFRLSDQAVTGLDVLTDARMPGSPGRAVIVRQRFGALPAGQDGMIAVGIVDGSIAYVSSSVAEEGAAPGTASLSAVEAWLRAAADAGRAVTAGSVGSVQDQNGWSVFAVAGFSHPQRARLTAFPIPGQGARAAWETIVLDVQGGAATAYKYFIDGGSGAVLFRQNAVNQLAQTSAFSGSYQDAPAPLACGPLHPFSVPAGTRSIAVSATAAAITNDIVLRLIFNGATVASSDTLTSPEGIHYAPGVLTPGTYNVQVCPFAGPIVPATPPYNYVGTFTANDVPVNFPYPPKWEVFPANPPLDLSSTDTRRTWCWESAVAGVPVPGCEMQVKNLAARAPWDHDTRTNAPTYTTRGNADSAASAWASPLTPAEGQRPVSAAREYSFAWTNQWQASKCSPSVFATPQRNDIDAATANLFAMHNRMHDWSYFLGFTEDAFNLQDNNFGNTAPGPFPLGREADPEVGDAQAGAVTGGQPSLLGRDNANQITLNDGIPPITNMYLWQPIAGAFYAPCVDGDFDMSVIGHEYTHAISNRMVGGPDSNLSSDQGGAMGESWSDLNAVEYLNEYGFVPTGGENPFAVGPYVTGNGQRGIRNYGMNASPLNFGNVGYDFVCNTSLISGTCVSLTQVHADGEIWSAVNFDIRRDLIAKYNASSPAANLQLQRDCADGKLPADGCPGNRRWIQIVHDAFLLMQPEVGMLDARDAYLAADLMRFGGANRTELWRAFARRGFGGGAGSGDGDDVDPIPSFESPLERPGTATFSAVAADENNAPVNAKIYVGHYEARSTAIANPAKLAAGQYTFLAQAEGYGAVRFSASFSAGQSKTIQIRMPTNWASRHKGAAVSGDGVNLANLIDDTEATNWARLNATPDARGSQVTVKLAGGPKNVTRVQVSAMLRPRDQNDPGGDTGSQNRFTALRQFEIWACRESAGNPNCADPLGFSRIFSSATDAFPGGAPRPVAPDLVLREFDVTDTVATHVRLRVVNNQCTGGPAFQGDQDNDPANNSDCASGSAHGRSVRAAELQVFSRAPAAGGGAEVFNLR